MVGSVNMSCSVRASVASESPSDEGTTAEPVGSWSRAWQGSSGGSWSQSSGWHNYGYGWSSQQSNQGWQGSSWSGYGESRNESQRREQPRNDQQEAGRNDRGAEQARDVPQPYQRDLVALRAWARNDIELGRVSDIICGRLTTHLYEYLRTNEGRPDRLSFNCLKECFKRYVRDEMNCCQFEIRKGQCVFVDLPRGCRYCHPAHWECSKYRNVFELVANDPRVRHRDGRFRPRRNYNRRNFSDTSSGYDSD